MKLKTLFSAICLFIITSVAAKDVVHFCGYSPEYVELYYPIVDQFIMGDPSMSPFFHCPLSTYCYDTDALNSTSENLKEWRRFLDINISEEKLKELIYNTPLETYQQSLDGDTTVTIAAITEDKRDGFLRYMLFAKASEYVQSVRSGGSGWRQGEQTDDETGRMQQLLEKALKSYGEVNSPFLKNRYGFQMVRLAHYLQESEASIAFFNNYVTLDPAFPYMYYRALEQKSGAAYNLEDMPQATKGFLDVYVNLPSRRLECAASLRFSGFGNLNTTTEFDLDKNELDAYYFLRAFNQGGNVAAEMLSLEKLNPQSKLLKVMAIRQVDKLQYTVFQDLNEGYIYYDLEKSDIKNIEALQGLAKRQLNNFKNKDTDFWKVILASSQLSDKNYTDALSILKTIDAKSEMKVQAKQLAFSINVLQVKTKDRSRINTLFLKLKNDADLYSKEAVSSFFFNRMAAIYGKENLVFGLLGRSSHYMNPKDQTWATAIGTLGSAYELQYKNNFVAEDAINPLQRLIDSQSKTDYEKLILKQLKGSPQDFVYDLKGTLYFQENRLSEAIEVFNKIERPFDFYGENIRHQLFSGSITEYFNVSFKSQSDGFADKYATLFPEQIEEGVVMGEYYNDNKLKLAQTFLMLERQVVNDPVNAADYYLMLGNGWYNLSEEGWFVNGLQYLSNNDRNTFLSYNYDTDAAFDQQDSSFINQSIVYFKKALETNGNKETKASATFMLAKTHRCAEYFQNANYEHRVEVCGEHYTYFKSLKEDYGDTEYEKLVLKECTWYQAFTSK